MRAGWVNGRLSDCILTISVGKSVNGGDTPATPLEKGVLKTSAVSTGRFRPSENKRVDGGESHLASVPVSAGTILVGRSNTRELVGASVLVRDNHPNLYLSDKIWAVRVKDKFDPAWLHAYLSSPKVLGALRKLSSGSSAGMKNISMPSLRGLEVRYPPLPEQRKIAAILGAWDDAIEKLEVELKARKIRRGALAEKTIFPSGKPRGLSWSPTARKWSIMRLQDVAREVSVRNTDLAVSEVLTCSKHRGFMRNSDYFGRSTHSADLRNYKLIGRDQFGFPSNHVEEGSIGIQNLITVALVSPIYTVFDFDHELVNPRFAYLVLKTNAYRHMFNVSTSSSVDRRGSLRWKEFSKLPFPVPPLETQLAIVDSISTADEELALIDRQIVLLREQKRGLMQKLLTGDIRVAVDPTEEAQP